MSLILPFQQFYISMQRFSSPKGYIFRLPTSPNNYQKNNTRQRERRQFRVNDLSVIGRPQQNFFKLVFQKDKYLWVVLHKTLRDGASMESRVLYERVKQAFKSLNADQNSLPICTQIEEFRRWTKDYQCRIAIDQSAVEYLDEVLATDNALTLRVINDKSIDMVRKIRQSKFSYKVRSVDDTFEPTLALIKQDIERVKISDDKTKIQKLKLPNFMHLRVRDKASMITYRSNIYCLANLHKNKDDLTVSKSRFIQQVKMEYTSAKDQAYINSYLTMPYNDRQILKFYTEDSFFYRCLNNTLRVAETTQEFFVIGEPFNKMFHAIKKIYKQQYPYTASRKKLKLYRGADLSGEECAKLEYSFGSYIEIHGFVSTTLDLQIAKKFAKDRNHNKILEFIFEDVSHCAPEILQNDYGFVNLKDISSFEQEEILFNTLNIFKVVGKEIRDGYEFYTLIYGSIFKVLGVDNPENLGKEDRMAYFTYKELMGEKAGFEDLGQMFLKTFETQKSVDYYQSKIREGKGTKAEMADLIIKKTEALIQNGEPGKALQSMIMLMGQRGNIKKSSDGESRFLQQILGNKDEINKEIDISKKYAVAGQNLDRFDEVESHLLQTSEALSFAITNRSWDFDIAYNQIQMKMKLIHLKESVQRYSEMYTLLKQTEKLIEDLLSKALSEDLSFHSLRKVYLEKTLVYQLMAKISPHLQGDQAINIDQLQEKFNQAEIQINSIIEDKSYDKSLVDIRKIQILKRREDFNLNKDQLVRQLEQSLISIKVSAIRDEEIPKTYEMMAEIQKSSNTLVSTNLAIGYFEKEFVTQSQYYGQNDPRSMKTVIEIAQCHRDLKDSQQSVDILREQLKLVPYNSKPKHTVLSKTLYAMGISYLDLGEYSYALQCFDKALNMLKETLSKADLAKYHHRFKLQMQIGKTYTGLIRYSEAEERLKMYHTFIWDLYKSEHSQIANSLNNLAILYLKWKKYQDSKNNFEKSCKMFKDTTGEKSIVCARIKCNLAMIYSIFSEKKKALRALDEAKQLFDEIYLKDNPQYQFHTSSEMLFYYYAEIYSKFKSYKSAIEFYDRSLQAHLAMKRKKVEDRQFASSKSTRSSNLQSSFMRITTDPTKKKESHEYICRVKKIECQYKDNDFSFLAEVEELIKELQKQTKDYDEIEQTKNKDKDLKDKNSKLKNLLKFCREIAAAAQNKKEMQIILEQNEDRNFQTNIKMI